MAKHRDISTRIAALRNMTVERGCTPEEAATAKKILDSFLGSKKTSENTDQRVGWQVWEQDREYGVSDNEMEEVRRKQRERDERDRAAREQRASDIRAKQAAEAAERYRQAAKVRAEEYAKKVWAEHEAKKEAKRKLEEEESYRRAAARKVAEARLQAEETRQREAREAVQKRVEERQREVFERRAKTVRSEADARAAKLEAIEKSPFRIHHVAGGDTCPLCKESGSMEISVKSDDASKLRYKCSECSSTFMPRKTFGDYWMYLVVQNNFEKSGEGTHRYRG